MTTWHTDAALIDAYLANRLDFGPAASVEAHVIGCPQCRDLLAVRTPEPGRAAIAAVWKDVRAELAVPPLPLVVRLLRRLGVSEQTGVLLAAARSMSTAWTLATVVIIAFAAASLPLGAAGVTLYLIVAPLVPVAGVVASFGPTHDPLAELTRSTAYPMARLVLLRSLGVAVTSVPFAVGIGVAMPVTQWLAFVWLVPALAFILLVLAAATWWDPIVAGGTLAVGWAAVIFTAARSGSPTQWVAGSAQYGYLAVAAVAGTILVLRIRRANGPGGII